MLASTPDDLYTSYDAELVKIAKYVMNEEKNKFSLLAYSTAHLCLMDALACAMMALQYPACTKLLGPIIPGTQLPIGSYVPGTNFYLDPILAAFNIGTLVRWLDFNDTWLAAEWGHPSDNLGAILACADYKSRKQLVEGQRPLNMKTVLSAMIKAHEIQGVLALENAFNRLGFDHVILVRIASTAVATHLLGGDTLAICQALSQAWIDGAALRTYRHAPNTGSRKSWAAGDATSRGVRLAWMTLQGEMGYQTPLTTKKWGFYDTILGGQSLNMTRNYESYVMENVLFKISFPAEFHAQTAVECAIQLHPEIQSKLDKIDKILVYTQESAMRIINKTGPLYNPADRDHCLQYMIAVALLQGNLKAEHYENDFAKEARIDQLRNKMRVEEDERFSKDYLDPEKRSIANAIQIYFIDGSCTEKITIEYPIGHKKRRQDGIPLLYKKFASSLSLHFNKNKAEELIDLFKDQATLEQMPVCDFMDRWVKS